MTFELDYKKDSHNSIELGSERIPLFVNNEMMKYRKDRQSIIDRINEINNYMSTLDIPKSEYDKLHNDLDYYYNELTLHKTWVKNKLNNFEKTGERLINKYHNEEEELYKKELHRNMEDLKYEVENWFIELTISPHSTTFKTPWLDRL